ncbi:putative endonuclease 4 [Rhizocola hellebori]|uniref:Probable endonuclease 4 n=1 Tax=Rhizocola hellebori TaxID=1392758 RepID=A0A8J3Q6Y6_9ACTN|nr:deoxyribonuclease IV [Rhizocola hellebori]GIH04965.1 putative endonuclease 4 [Rhizocola hellebori]
MQVRIGAHVPAKTALSYVDEVGADALQLYVGNSRGWARPPGDPKLDEAFAAGCVERDIPAYIHASLLVNLGSPTAATVEQSVQVLAHALLRARQIGARAVVFHAGSAVDPTYTAVAMKQVSESLLPLLELIADDGPALLVEPSAGGGRSLASKIEDLGPYLDMVDRHPGLGVCFDTCHAWAAGHDLATPGGMKATLDELVEVCGPGRLKLVHANDSKDTCGSARDRHESIGAGAIGADAFAEMLGHPALEGVPVIIETPGERHSDDISLLRGLRTT